MRTSPIARTVVAASMVLAPLLSLGSAFFASAALNTSSQAEVSAIAADPTRFYIYAITQLVGAYLFIPAFVGVMGMLRESRPRWADLAGGGVLLGLLVAIGDSAGELFYWQMGAPGANLGQMGALADRYENAAGSSLPYGIGGIMLIVTSIALGIGLARSRTTPVWSAILIPVGLVANIAGYASGSQPVLIASWAALLVALAQTARVYLNRTAPERELVAA
jgi:hypothetical protein